MTATPIPHPLPARSRLALLAIMAVAMLVAMVSGCVSAAINENARTLQTQLTDLHDASRPLPGSDAKQVAEWNRGWAAAMSATAAIERASR